MINGHSYPVQFMFLKLLLWFGGVNEVTLTTLLLVEVWVTAGLLTQVSSGDTHRVINTLSEARQTGEVD